MRQKTVIALFSFMLASPFVVHAAGPSSDWSESWSFPSAGSKSQVLIQADMIKRAEEDYYDNFGKSTIKYYINNNSNLTVNNSYDYSETMTCGDGSQCDLSETTSTAIASQNNTTVNTDGRGNTVVVDSASTNTGAVSGEINNTTAGGGISYGNVTRSVGDGTVTGGSYANSSIAANGSVNTGTYSDSSFYNNTSANTTTNTNITAGGSVFTGTANFDDIRIDD